MRRAKDDHDFIAGDGLSGENGIMSLDMLARSIKHKKAGHEMNEVFADFYDRGLVGFFVRNGEPQAVRQRMAEAYVVTKYLKDAHHIDVPLMILDEKKGRLSEFQLSDKILQRAVGVINDLGYDTVALESLTPNAEEPFTFRKYVEPLPGPQVKQVVEQVARKLEDDHKIVIDVDRVVEKMAQDYENFDGSTRSAQEMRCSRLGDGLSDVNEDFLVMALKQVYSEDLIVIINSDKLDDLVWSSVESALEQQRIGSLPSVVAVAANANPQNDVVLDVGKGSLLEEADVAQLVTSGISR